MPETLPPIRHWDRPICETCWRGRNPGQKPFRLFMEYVSLPEEPCVICGGPAHDGICIRMDPREATQLRDERNA